MSVLASNFDSGQFVITSELTPPKGTDLSGLKSKGVAVSAYIDAFNVTDSHASKMSMTPLAAAHSLISDGIEPILQMTTRDRNRIALQSDMLGAWVLGIRNLVCMGGDPPHLGDHPDAKPVFDLSTMDLISAAASLTSGADLMGNSLNQATGFFIGAVVNPGAADLTQEITRLEEKIDAGARFFQTQAIFDADLFDRFMERIAHLDIAILAGIMPIKSAAMATFMNEKIPGIDIPEALIKRIYEAEDKIEESIAITADIIAGVRGSCQGIHVMALGWEEHIPIILRRAFPLSKAFACVSD